MGETILVTGGTGTLGRKLVPLLLHAGRKVRIASRTPVTIDGAEHLACDLLLDRGVRDAMDGIDTIIHCAGAAKGDSVLARNLLRAAKDAGVRRIVHMSVVGTDRVPVERPLDRMMFGYFAEKAEAERIVRNSGLAWTILRATQFHELMLLVVEALSKMWVAPLPAGFRFQPIGAGDVAKRLLASVLEEQQGVHEIGGPQIHSFAELVLGYFAASGTRRPIVYLPMPGKAAAAFRAGANLAPDHATGAETWGSFIGRRLGRVAEGQSLARST